MMNEIKIVDSDGQVIGFAQMTPELLAKTDDESLEDMGYVGKIVSARLKDVDKEIKTRLEAGHSFSRVGMTKRQKKMVPVDDFGIKARFIDKYGLGAVELKSVAKLKKEFGDAITTDLETITVIDETNVVKWN